MTKTAANTKDAVSPGAVKDSTEDRRRQTKRGPHKSPGLQKLSKSDMREIQNRNDQS